MRKRVSGSTSKKISTKIFTVLLIVLFSHVHAAKIYFSGSRFQHSKRIVYTAVWLCPHTKI